MIVTRFLSPHEFGKYPEWLKQQDKETLRMYFGVTVSPEYIDIILKKLESNPEDHNLLIAEQRGKIAGFVHLATYKSEMELGIMVGKEFRGKRLGSRLIKEAILWARNRGHKNLYMHCLAWNTPVKHLCIKHGLTMTNMYGESEVKCELPDATYATLMQEAAQAQAQLWMVTVENLNPLAYTL